MEGSPSSISEKEKRLQQCLQLVNSRNKLEKFAACRDLSSEDFKGEKRAWGVLMGKTEDGDKDVRRQATIGLGVVAERGDNNTIQLLCQLCWDREWSVREAAVRSVVSVDCGVSKGEGAMGAPGAEPLEQEWHPAIPEVMECVGKTMTDPIAEVRCTATHLLGECAQRGSSFAITCLLQSGAEKCAIWSMEAEEYDVLRFASENMVNPPRFSTARTGTFGSNFDNSWSSFVSIGSSASQGPTGIMGGFPTQKAKELPDNFGGSFSSLVSMGSNASADAKPWGGRSRRERRIMAKQPATMSRGSSENSMAEGKSPSSLSRQQSKGMLGADGFKSLGSSALSMSLVQSWKGLASIGSRDWNPKIRPPASALLPKPERLPASSMGGTSQYTSLMPSISSVSSSQPDSENSSSSNLVWAKVYMGLIGQHAPLSGKVVRCSAVHPPQLVTDEICEEQGEVEWVAVFELENGESTLYYDCALRACDRGAHGVMFVHQDAKGLAVGVVKHDKMFTGPEEVHPSVFPIPVVFIGSENLPALTQDRACVFLEPNPSMKQARFADESAAVRIAAAHAICKISLVDDMRVLKGLLELIADQERGVRSACVQALSNRGVCSACNVIATLGLAEQSMHENAEIRESAMLAMIKVVQTEGLNYVDFAMLDVVVSALRERLSDPDGMIRKLAVELLVQLALADGIINEDDIGIIGTFIEAIFQDGGDPIVTTSCAKSLSIISKEDKEVTVGFHWLVDGRVSIRQKAIKSLGLAHKGNLVVLSVLRKALEDPEGLVREETVKSLVKVAEKGDLEFLELTIELLNDTVAGVRTSACHALVELFDPEDRAFCRSICEGLLELLQDVAVEARSASKEALGRIAAVSEELREEALTGIWKNMVHENKAVRRSALEALPKLVEVGDDSIIKGIVLGLRDSYTETQKKAITMIKSNLPDAKDRGDAVLDLKAALIEACDSEEALVRAMALETLPYVFCRGDPDAVKALMRCLKFEGQTVPETSARILGELSNFGDERAVSLMIPLLDSPMGYVRRSAVTSLGLLSPRGDPRVIQGIMKLLQDKEQYVRLECCEALPKVSTKGLPSAIEALATLTSDADEKIRSLAIDGLRVIADKGNKVAIDALMQRFKAEGRSLRRVSVEALGGIVVGKDRDSLLQVIMCIEDSDEYVKATAVKTILLAAEKGDMVLLNSLLSHQFVHQDRRVRDSAQQIVTGLAHQGDQQVITKLLECCHDPSAAIRKQACATVCKIALSGDESVITALADMILDSDADVQKVAVESLGIVAGCKNDRLVIIVLTEKLTCKDWAGREAAAGAMLMHTDRGNAAAVSAVANLVVQHEDVYVRETAVSTLTKLALPCTCKLASGDPCDCTVVECLLKGTHDQIPRMRKACIEALELLGNRKDKLIADRVKREMLNDPDFAVRGAVEHAMGIFKG